MLAVCPVKERTPTIVTDRYDVLIADKNPHIRDFLRREFTAAGYTVRVAENSNQLLRIIYGPGPLDLLIMDPDLPGADAADLSQKLRDRVPPLPVVLHTLEPEHQNRHWSLYRSRWIEKNGCSIENLKQAVAGILPASQPPVVK